MVTLRIKCLDFWAGFQFKESIFYRILSSKYQVEETENPDIILFSCFGNRFLSSKYDNCIKIFFTGENITPDFNLCDYALAFDHLSFGDRYMRFPLFYTYPSFDLLRKKTMQKTPEQLLQRKFCSFVVSNADANPYRDLFFKRLSEYKKVDSGGRLYNNIGGPISDKLDFISQYKFNIAIENSSAPGYTTEKIMEPFVSDTLPLYWGNPLIEDDFNPQTFINLHDFNSIEDAVNFIICVDNNDNLYLEYFRYRNQLLSPFGTSYEKYFLRFFDNIVANMEKGAAKYVNEESQYKRMMYQARKYHNIMFTMKHKLSKLIGG